MKVESRFINGLKVFGFTKTQEIFKKIVENPAILLAINAEKIYSNKTFLKELSKNNITYADGIGAVLALKFKGVKNAIRIPGSELWLEIINYFKDTKSFYLIGADQDTIELVINNLKYDFKDINIVGFHNGYLNSQSTKKVYSDIKLKKPDFVFVAQGSPKQEKLMSELMKIHKCIYMGLGGSFDVYTGKVKRAPKLFRNFGFEWLYRLISQPTRIKRQIVLIPFLINLLRNKY